MLYDKRHITIQQVRHIYAEQAPDDDDERDDSFETMEMSKSRHVKGVWKALADAVDAESSEEQVQLKQGVNLNTNPTVSKYLHLKS